MTTETENQNLAIAHTFIEQFLGKGDMSVAEQLLDDKRASDYRIKANRFY